MKFSSHIALVAALALSACSKVEYFESPMMEEYILSQAPGITDSSIHRIEVCEASGATFASALFHDGMLYHYKLDLAENRIALGYSTTYGAPDPQNVSAGPPKACIHSAGRYVINRDVVPVGGQRQLTYSVRGDFLDGRVFDDSVKAELKLVAQVAMDAVAARKGPILPRESWGVTQ
jgi:hypothetical protein